MKRNARWVWSVLTVLSLGAAASVARADEAAQVSAGHELFEKNCVMCHGPQGRGDGPLADDLKVHPADLTGIAARRAGNFPDAEISEIIDGRRRVRGHGNEMPIWGREFAEKTTDPAERTAAIRENIAKLVAYLHSIQAAPKQTGGGH